MKTDHFSTGAPEIITLDKARQRPAHAMPSQHGPAGSLHRPTYRDLFLEAQRRCDAGQPVWKWFDRRQGGHGPGGSMKGLEGQDALKAWMQQTDAAAGKKQERCIYVHIPFCRHICSFCSFYREASRGDKHAAYVEALCAQIARVAQRPWTQRGPAFSAVYMGGGTPTALSADECARVVRSIRDHFPLADDVEFTVETRFDGVDAAYLDQLCATGVNRFSFGVQTFDSNLRRRAGRRASGETVLALLKSLGDRPLINCDLIANLPGQSVESWAKDFQQLAQTAATSASVYALIPMPSSALIQQIQQGKHPPLPGLDFEYALHQVTVAAINKRPDWRRFNFHHYGHAKRETNRYNGVRIGKMDTLALGSGAGGRIGNLNYMSCRDVDHFIGMAEDAQNDCAMAFPEHQQHRQGNQASALVEGPGIDQALLEDILPSFCEYLPLLDELGFLQYSSAEKSYSLTPLGDFWGYNIIGLIKETVRACTDT